MEIAQLVYTIYFYYLSIGQWLLSVSMSQTLKTGVDWIVVFWGEIIYIFALPLAKFAWSFSLFIAVVFRLPMLLPLMCIEFWMHCQYSCVINSRLFFLVLLLILSFCFLKVGHLQSTCLSSCRRPEIWWTWRSEGFSQMAVCHHFFYWHSSTVVETVNYFQLFLVEKCVVWSGF